MRFDSTELDVLVEEAYKHPNDLQRRNINITQRNLILDQHLCQSKRHWEIKKKERRWQDLRCRTNAKLFTSCWQNNKIIPQPLITGYHPLHRELHTWAIAAPTKQLVSTMSGASRPLRLLMGSQKPHKTRVWFVKCFQCSWYF